MTPLVTYPLLVFLLVLAVWFIHHIRKDPRANPLDLITAPDTGRLSAAKIGQLVGVVVSSWVVVSTASAGTLSFDTFALYLAYVGGMDAFGKYLRAKEARRTTKKPEGE